MALWKEDLVNINPYSRPAIPLVGVRGLVLHYTANRGGTAENHADFFDGPDGGGGRSASAHIFVDRDSAVLIVPLHEVTYHANDMSCKIDKLKASVPYYRNGNANLTTIGVEMCLETDGSIHPETIKRTVQIFVELCRRTGLTANDIYRHYDVTGKNCPAPFVADPSLFSKFKQDVQKELSGSQPYKVIVPNTALWQARNLVIEYGTKGYKCEGTGYPQHDYDACPFVLYTEYRNAVQLVIELHHKGYTKAYGEEI